MVCSQCTIELPTTATTCSQCGSSIPHGQANTFTYLPPGVPAWPTSVPAHLPNLVEATTDQSSMAATKANVKIGTQAKSSMPRAINLILILVITPLLGILATLGMLSIEGQFPPHSHSSPATLSHIPVTSGSIGSVNPGSGSTNPLPTPTAFKSASDTNMNISLQYPADWTVGPVDQSNDPIGLPLTQPNHLVSMEVQRFSNTLSAQIPGPDQINKVLLGQVSQSVSGLKIVTSSNAKPTIGNDQWIEQDATYTKLDNSVGHFATLTVLHNHQNYYNITFVVPEGLYGDAMQKDIQPIFNSFKFIS